MLGPNGDLASAKLVLFGGATALEGQSKGSSDPPSSPGPASYSPNSTATGIRLAGATNEVHVLDVATGHWEKIVPAGEPPSPRAAHAAAAVGSMVVVQGGIGPAGLATEDLHVLDFTDFDRPRWHRVMVQGPGPSARYAHVLSMVANRFLVAIGGNDGKQTLSDAWALDTNEKPYQWKKIAECGGEEPPARMYATATARSDGLLLLCGGRDAAGSPLGDAFGLARHRDGRWEWAAAPGSLPSPRYQHGSVFVNARLHVIGGAVGGGKMVDAGEAAVVLDTAAGCWVGVEEQGGRMTEKEVDPDLTRRCRHAVASVGPFIFVHGGLRGSTLLEDCLVAQDFQTAIGGGGGGGGDGGEGNVTGEDYYSDLSVFDPRTEAWQHWLSESRGAEAAKALAIAAAEEAAIAEANLRRIENVENLRDLSTMHNDEELPQVPSGSESTKSLSLARAELRHRNQDRDSGDGFPVGRDMPTPDVRLYHRAFVVAHDVSGQLRGMVRQLSIDQFENEARRLSMNSEGGIATSLYHSVRPEVGHLIEPGIQRSFLRLLQPRTWRPPEDREFAFSYDEISALCDKAEAVFREEPSVLQLRAPVKIFGDLHGQFGDLMRLFEEYGAPSKAGDITYIDYLFLGDYVDRGAHSLETICLLLALKVEHPHHVHLIRGNHEAADINALFGFRLECLERLGDAAGVKAWQRFNELFNWLPLAALVEDQVLCMHGGIGRSITSVEQINSLSRPLTMEDGGLVLMDLLWSDPTVNDTVEGVQPSPRGPGLVTFGPDRVMEFCETNSLRMIVRAHECVMDGFERFAQGKLITLFSATNYCGTANNAGAILVLGRDLVMVPKLIHPLPPATPRGSPGPQESPSMEEPPTPYAGAAHMNGMDTWMATVNEERPPTPPRGRGGPQSLAFI